MAEKVAEKVAGGKTGLGEGMEFRILGSMEVRSGARSEVLSGRLQRTLLAVLLARANQRVPADTLAGALWGEQPGPRAAQRLQLHVHRLRGLLDQPQRLSFGAGGYRLRVKPGEVDAERFESSAVEAEKVAVRQPQRAVELLRGALSLWRDAPFADIDVPVVADWSRRLADRRLTAIESLYRAELACGLNAAIIGELQDLVGEHPLREELHGLLMTALYRAGRPAEALAAFRNARDILVAELGLEPGPGLRDLQGRILAGESLRPETDGSAGSSSGPAQLPVDMRAFAGRRAQLAELDGLPSVGAPAAIAVVAGPAGVGKTALAVHWAHRAAPRFPDGQLYLNLRGFDPGGHAMLPGEALRALLELLRVPPERIAGSVEAQAGLYRSLLAGARMLVVLDNARDAEQVRPLLPGSPGSMVVVTSRDQLTGLVAETAAQPIRLTPLGPDEARLLLAKRLGQARLDAEPEAVDQIIAGCGGLPLALAIVTARAVTSPGFALAVFAAELADLRGRLDALAGADRATDIRAVFSWSYRALRPPAARLFRLLGLHPGPELGLDAASSLAGEPPARVRRLLAELTGANLLSEPAPGRYVLHDLLRVYAAELADSTETEAERRSASARMFDHYAHTAQSANRLLSPSRTPMRLPLGEAAATISLTHLADDRQASNWFHTEHYVLLAVLRLAAGTGYPTHAWQLAWSFETFLDRIGDWQHKADAWQCALDCSGDLDKAAQADAHRVLAGTLANLDRHADAIHHLEQALDLSIQDGDLMGQANVHRIFGYTHSKQGNPRAALRHALEGLSIYRAAGAQDRVAGMLNNVGACYALLDDHVRAIEYCTQALPLLQQRGDRDQEAHTWDSLGYSHHHLGRHAEAVDCYGRAIALFSRLGSSYHRARSLDALGEVHRASGDLTAARACWQEAVALLTELGHPETASTRAKLDDPHSSSASG